MSYARCKNCYFAENRGNNTRDEFGGAISIYRVIQFENMDTVPRYEFIDWYTITILTDDSLHVCCSTFENNSGNNGIFTITHLPLTFNGTTKFIGNTGSDALKVVFRTL